MSDAIFRFTPGRLPLLVSMPHVGTRVPEPLLDRFTPQARSLADTDWHVDELYDFLDAMGASVLAANYSRYVIDLNRPPDDANLYPGQNGPGLFPTETFDGHPVYRPGMAPEDTERLDRRTRYWDPYHRQIQAELARLRAEHGYALLWEAHSIAPVLPRLFDGRLPDLNLGSNAGAACPAPVALAVLDAAGTGYSKVLDGRFRGGFITRHYGRPDERIFALQLELAQSTHLMDGDTALDPVRAGRLRPVLHRMIDRFLNSAAQHLENAQ